MKPRRTYISNMVISLPGGNEDNDLWAYASKDCEGTPIIRSTWVPTDEERQRILEGENIELFVWGTGMPPVALGLCRYPLGAPPSEEAGER